MNKSSRKEMMPSLSENNIVFSYESIVQLQNRTTEASKFSIIVLS